MNKDQIMSLVGSAMLFIGGILTGSGKISADNWGAIQDAVVNGAPYLVALILAIMKATQHTDAKVVAKAAVVEAKTQANPEAKPDAK